MKLCIALNANTRASCVALLQDLEKNTNPNEFEDIYIKIGLQGFIRDGKDAIFDVKKHLPLAKIFLDLKLYDIPDTMAQAAVCCHNLGVDLITVHASSGKEALKAVAIKLKARQNPPLIFGVSALTSFDEKSFFEIYNNPLMESVSNLSRLCFESGIDGVVCSAHESLNIKSKTSPSFLTLCPAIRPFGESANDQKRVANLDFAYENKANFIVIGRPIYEASSPSTVLNKILSKIKQLKS